jgi:hypothetical protein
MASKPMIEDSPKLSVVINEDGSVDATVKATVVLDPALVDIMKLVSSPMIRVRCTLWGDDDGFNDDNDRLFDYKHQYIPSADNPASKRVQVTFRRRIEKGVLDEDTGGFSSFFNGHIDEVFGAVYLYSASALVPSSNDSGLLVRENTPNVSRGFPPA